MANKKKTSHYTEKEKKQLLRNVDAMRERFQGEPLSGENLALLKRKVVEDAKSYRKFKLDLEKRQPLLYQLLTGDTLQGYSTIYNVISGREEPSKVFVKDMAAFCTKAFSFDEDITEEDLLGRDIKFPPLRRINERWERYVGVYRCFYPYQGAQSLSLRGGFLQLNEENGQLFCRFVTGIRRDKRFDDVMKLFLADISKQEFVRVFEEYNKSLPESEARLVCYEGEADVTILGYLLFKAPRKDNENVALITLRRFDTSSQPHYSGCIATVTLYRKDDVVTYPMTVSQQEFSLNGEKDVLLQYLKKSIHGEAGMKISEDMDKNWNQTVMDWCFDREGE